MNHSNQKVPDPQDSPFIKVSSPQYKPRRASHEQIPAWTKLRWKVSYWRNAHWRLPRLKGSRGAALLVALLLVAGFVPLVFAGAYTVQSGDTLFQIARRHNTSVSDIAAVNGLANPNLIHAGQILEIPGQRQPTTAVSAPIQSGTAYNTAGYAESVVVQTNADYETTYIVQHGDTLYSIARYYGMTVAELAHANSIYNVHALKVGQVLLIPLGASVYADEPPSYYEEHAYGLPTGAFEPTNPYFPSTLPDVPHTPATTETSPSVQTDLGCTRFNFMQGRDWYRGSLAGVYVMHDMTGGQIASWYANEGDVDSGWINGLPLSFTSVHVRVTFYPKWGGGSPVQMEIVNPAPGTAYGWLTQGACHSIEIQYPGGY